MEWLGNNISIGIKHKCNSLSPWCIGHLRNANREVSLIIVEAVIHAEWILLIPDACGNSKEVHRASGAGEVTSLRSRHVVPGSRGGEAGRRAIKVNECVTDMVREFMGDGKSPFMEDSTLVQ